MGGTAAPCGGGKVCLFLAPHGASAVMRVDDVPCVTKHAQLTALSNCTELDYLCVHSCPDCVDLKPLGSVPLNITGFRTPHLASSASVLIGSNPQLASIAELRELTGSLPGALKVVGNPKLEALDGLEGLRAIGRDDALHLHPLLLRPFSR